jgi:putative membrane protein
MSFATPLLAAHMAANVVWIGAIVAVAWLTGRARLMADGAEIGRLAVLFYRRFAVPAFVISFLAGLGRLLTMPREYMQLHWMHGKLTFALIVIVLHHVAGGRAKRVAGGSMQAGQNSAILWISLLLCAAIVVVFAIFKSQLVP